MKIALPSAPGVIPMTRRRFLAAAATLPAMGLLPRRALGQSFWDLPRTLRLVRHQTGERINATYWADGRLIPEGYLQICRLLRDVRANKAVQMDVVLLDILRGIQGFFEAYGIQEDIHATSGHRTLETNELTEGAAQNSLHPPGKAADIFIPNISVDYLGKLGLYLAGGGVGFYQAKKFVHTDCGRIRTWRG